MTTILALDAATKCGWAIHQNGAIEASGVWDLSVRRDESGGMRLVRLRAKLDELYRICGVCLVVFEASRNLKHGNAIRVAAELQGVIKLWCQDVKLDYRGYSPAEIKKFATGKGNCGKNEMRLAAHKRWPEAHGYVEDWIPDEADARWLAELAASEYANEIA